MTTIKKLKSEWIDTEQYHQYIKELFEGLVNGYPELNAHRDFCENGWGFGERAFWYAWKLILDEIKTDVPKLCEIGVYKASTLSLWRILKPVADIYGITPLNTTGDYPNFDYKADIEAIHNHFNQEQPKIIEGYSQLSFCIGTAKNASPFDVIYLDGLHTFDGVLSDLNNYAPMVLKGGFLVMDDCCCDFHEPWGFFQGHQEVQNAFDEYMSIHNHEWEFVFNVVHLRVMRKK